MSGQRYRHVFDNCVRIKYKQNPGCRLHNNKIKVGWGFLSLRHNHITRRCVGYFKDNVGWGRMICHPELAAPLVADEKEAYKGGCSQSISGSSHRQKCSAICTQKSNVGLKAQPTLIFDLPRRRSIVMQGLRPHSPRRIAFTLAEVLITLGIIGVVAAMTLPTLINKYKIAVLQTQFKKSYSVMQQVVLKAKAEAGIENFGKYCSSYDGSNYVNQEECYPYLYKALNNTNHKDRYEKDANYIERKDTIYNLIGNPVNTNARQFLNTNRRFNDTSYADFFILGGQVNVYVDTNGSAPPNRLGYDIFYFYVDSKDTLAGWKMTRKYTEEELEDLKNNSEAGKEWQYENAGSPCSFTSTQGSNGSGCAYYAIIDVNPDTEKSGYWKSLK